MSPPRLSTTYLGLELRSPLVAAASPLSETLPRLRALEDAGAGAIVLFSLFEEQLSLDPPRLAAWLAVARSEPFAGRDKRPLHTDPLAYLEHVRRAKKAVDVPIIASVNGSPSLGWTHYLSLLEQAGADALELNLYFVPTDPTLGAADLEARYLETIAAAARTVAIPVSVKLSPYFTNLSAFAPRAADAGAAGLVLFNRFFQPDLDLSELRVRPHLTLSEPSALRLPLRWIAILAGRTQADLAASGGVASGVDALKLLFVGAQVVELCSALLRRGVPYLKQMEQEMADWMDAYGFESVDHLRGQLSQACSEDPSAFERAQHVQAVGEATIDGEWARFVAEPH